MKLFSKDSERFPPIALGTMSLGTDKSRAISLVSHALDGGIRMLDTADLYGYGEIEEVIGKAIKGRRKEVILVSKGGNQPNPERSGWSWNPHPDYLEKALHQSLKRLGTDYLDLYLLHGGTMEDPIDEVIAFMQKKKKAGTILGYGISSIRPQVVRYWAEQSDLSAVMCQYSVLDRRPEEQVFPLLHKHGIPVLARGTLAKGMLAGKPATSYLGQNADHIGGIIHSFEAMQSIQEADHAALTFSLSESAVSTAVVGTSSIAQVDRLLNWEILSDLSWVSQFKQKHPANVYQQPRI